MTITISELITELQKVESQYGGDLMVVTDSEDSVLGAEYNDTEGSPAAVIVTE